MIAQLNSASMALILSFGFRFAGALREVGRTFDRWVDTAWCRLAVARQAPQSRR